MDAYSIESQKWRGIFMASIIHAILALASTYSSSTPPPALPKEIEVYQNKYDSCLYYVALAYDDGKTPATSLAKVMIYQCEKSLKDLASIKARGSENFDSVEIYYEYKLRNDLEHALVMASSAAFEREEKEKRKLMDKPISP